jgi:hypothetical protein
MMKSLLMALQIFAVEPAADQTSDFDFYLEELVSHELATSAPMSQLIIQNLATAIFDTDSAEVFYSRIAKLKESFRDNPRRAERFVALNQALQRAFDVKLQEAKRLRVIYSAAGAIVGALIGIPVGKAIGSSNKVLLLTIPVASAVGGGAGFLMGNLMVMPDYEFDSRALDFQMNELESED